MKYKLLMPLVLAAGCNNAARPLKMPVTSLSSPLTCDSGSIDVRNWPFCCQSAPALTGDGSVEVTGSAGFEAKIVRFGASEGQQVEAFNTKSESVRYEVYDQNCVWIAGARPRSGDDPPSLKFHLAWYYLVVQSGDPIRIEARGAGRNAPQAAAPLPAIAVRSLACEGAPPDYAPFADTSQWCEPPAAADVALFEGAVLNDCGGHQGSLVRVVEDSCAVFIGAGRHYDSSVFGRWVVDGKTSITMLFESYDTRCMRSGTDTPGLAEGWPQYFPLRASEIRRFDLLDAAPGNVVMAVLPRPSAESVPDLVFPNHAVVQPCGECAGMCGI